MRLLLFIAPAWLLASACQPEPPAPAPAAQAPASTPIQWEQLDYVPRDRKTAPRKAHEFGDCSPRDLQNFTCDTIIH